MLHSRIDFSKTKAPDSGPFSGLLANGASHKGNLHSFFHHLPPQFVQRFTAVLCDNFSIH